MAATILVVDDHPTIRAALRVVLAAEGNRILEASDGTRALEVVAEEPADLVILDLNLPGMSGEEVLREVRDRIPPIPVIVVTAEEAEERRVLSLGAVAYLRKPFGPEQLLSCVASALAAGGSPGGSP
jgi:DNA-binding response OmpR family regulator